MDTQEQVEKPRSRKIGKPRCKALVRQRDTYRYTGRTKSGFQMHYREKQCDHKAINNGHCKTHDKTWTMDCRWAEETFTA